MKQNIRKNTNNQQNIKIIAVLAVVILLAIILAVIFSKPGKDTKESETSKVTESELETLETKSEEEIAMEKASIEVLVSQYRDAFEDADIEALKIIYNTDDVMNSSTIEATAKIITGYENTLCYIKDGMDANSKVVFIYDDLKVDGIKTLIPNIAYVYMMQKDDGSFYIYPGEYDLNTANYVYSSEIQKYISELIKDNDIKKLYAETNEKFNQACSEDPDVQAFVDKLTQANNGAEAPVESVAETEAKETAAESESVSESN